MRCLWLTLLTLSTVAYNGSNGQWNTVGHGTNTYFANWYTYLAFGYVGLGLVGSMLLERTNKEESNR